jgi:hypothetical protein
MDLLQRLCVPLTPGPSPPEGRGEQIPGQSFPARPWANLSEPQRFPSIIKDDFFLQKVTRKFAVVSYYVFSRSRRIVISLGKTRKTENEKNLPFVK